MPRNTSPSSGPNRKITITAAAVLIGALVFGVVSMLGGGDGRTPGGAPSSASPPAARQDGPGRRAAHADDPRAGSDARTRRSSWSSTPTSSARSAGSSPATSVRS
ncbi:hypothetical protein [Actinomadura sp. CNU-125]|uniref:hypothetical protein n=1 Tax=Actinomadura sp. CNU-125 TaxID=1904961 RepID=UPI0021CCD77F|nr:hypothetical protein [Actinomadura sp. CNU-125]